MKAIAESDVKISLFEKVAYSFGDFASNIIYAGVATYLTFFYTDIVAIPATVVGSIFLFSRIFDAVSDLTIGYLMQKIKSRHGKARVWLLWLAIPFGLSTVLLFTVPNTTLTGKIIYAFITYNLATTVIFTAINIPYGVLNSLMTEDQVERGILNTFRMIAAYAASIMISAVTLPMVEQFGGGQRGWVMTFAIMGVLGTCLFLITFKFCKERVGNNFDEEIVNVVEADVAIAEVHSAPEKDAKLSDILKSLIRNKYWVIVVLFSLVLNFGYSLMGIYTYYAKYILGSANFATLMFTFRNIIELIGVIIAVPFLKRFGKRNICLISGFIIVLGQIILLVGQNAGTAVLLIGISASGLGMGAMFGSIFAMIADTMEYEEWRSGFRAEGIIYSAATFGQKIGNAIAGASIGWILGLSGYKEGLSTQSSAVLSSIDFIFIWLPLVIGIIIIILMFMYKLDKEYPKIIKELHDRKKTKSKG